MSDKWIMRGIGENERGCIKTVEELGIYIQKVGFLPLFRNEVTGFSVEEHVPPDYWWTDDESRDPWCWRMRLAERDDIAYGKFFGGKAGFVSKEWFSCFACARRDGYDFDSREDEGLAKNEDKKIMQLFTEHSSCDTTYLRQTSELKHRFELTMTRLMFETYIIIESFTQRINKQGLPYGWHMAVYTTPERKWGYDHVTSAYKLGKAKSRELIYAKLSEIDPKADFSPVLGL